MKHLKELLFSLARGLSVREAWRRAGFTSQTEAQRALRELAKSIPGEESEEDAVHAEKGCSGASRSGAGSLVVYVDGASRGNPGPSSVGAVVFLAGGEELTSLSKPIGQATNNVAEYKAVLEGLRLAAGLGAERVEIRLDSELVARQLNREYRIKSKDLQLLSQAVFREADRFASCRFVHVPRTLNRKADLLANEALDNDRAEA
jgi:ribonuclease HI